MERTVQEHIDAIATEHRALFDRVHGLILDEHPSATIRLSYDMPTYAVGGHRLHVGTWSHGVSLYGWSEDHDGGFVERHPELRSGAGTIRLTPDAAAGITDDELRGLIRGTLG